MRKLILIAVLCISQLVSSQNDIIADDYFKRGEFEKALISYQRLYDEKPGGTKYLYKIISTLQQLERFDEAEQLMLQKLTKSNSPMLIVELGYNYQLKDSLDLAKTKYDEAMTYLDERPYYVYSLARKFEEHSLLDYAIKVYEKGMVLQPEKNYNIQLARIYADQGDVPKMFTNYIDYLEDKPTFISNAKRAISGFISENSSNENNATLRKLLLKKLQASPEAHWYELLSWLYVQEKAYNKSFTQEKALYRRNPESLDRIIDLGIAALDDKQYDVTKDVFNYILETSQDVPTLLLAHQYLLDIDTELGTQEEYPQINDKYLELFNIYGKFEPTLPLQISYGNFLAFYVNKPKEGSNFLKQSLKLTLSPFQEASVKLKIADILVFQEKFNEALIYYSQIQANLKNSTIAQEARFKVAKTSYYKGDFEWAESQLKILKSSTSQLIANDALDLKLLISDNKYEDSTQTALKIYAKADLMAYQNNTSKAIELLEKILVEHKGESIIDQALFKQAQLYEKKKQYRKAEVNYQKIIADYREDILADDAYFHLAELYNYHLAEPEKAKPLYEKVLFEHEDSIYFIEARKKFRMLRGDAIN
ncbi:tetratricopeptide repeat protein [Winogradskyella sp. 3972H.M.0a.05]|uniref:tetratricopeptide repeat protein n=1 Tax=Winogradskyella sp. 3972H.M.0a.05 TaxID=2950277 RepID=UPI0033976EAC